TDSKFAFKLDQFFKITSQAWCPTPMPRQPRVMGLMRAIVSQALPN
ncbi:hypothetical protein MELB17_09593, partial [Marinobacter sp. ELB17]